MRPASVPSSLTAMRRHLVEHAEEVALVDDEQRAVGVARDGGGARSVVEQRQLTHHRTGPSVVTLRPLRFTVAVPSSSTNASRAV